ncbi:MAG: OadG family protein [Huintestinicola sp.]
MQMEWDYVGAVVISGLVIVFSALVLLILMVTIMGKIFTSLKNKSKPEIAPPKAQSAPAAPAPKAETAVDENGISDEIVAVIAAAVAAMSAEDGKTYAVKSIRKSVEKRGRSSWAAAAAAESTRSF